MSLLAIFRFLKMIYIVNKYNLAKYIFPGRKLALLRFLFYLNPVFWVTVRAVKLRVLSVYVWH